MAEPLRSIVRNSFREKLAQGGVASTLTVRMFRGVEIATLTQREVSYTKLRQQIIDCGADPENPGLTHYLSAFQYGMPEEGGFGLGIARLVQKLLGLTNVKEAELFPRDTKRVTP